MINTVFVMVKGINVAAVCELFMSFFVDYRY